jgi:L-asparaginase
MEKQLHLKCLRCIYAEKVHGPEGFTETLFCSNERTKEPPAAIGFMSVDATACDFFSPEDSDAEEILVLVLGGTFLKEYEPITGTLGFPEKSRMDEIIKTTGYRGKLRVKEVMLKDSLDMTEQDRQLVIDKVRAADQRLAIIVMGTDRMALMARRLAEAGLGQDKRIILVGAMTPASCAGSDALANLGFALAAVLL